LSGDDDKQKHISLEALMFCPIVVSRLGKKSSLCVLGVLARENIRIHLRESAVNNILLFASN